MIRFMAETSGQRPEVVASWMYERYAAVIAKDNMHGVSGKRSADLIEKTAIERRCSTRKTAAFQSTPPPNLQTGCEPNRRPRPPRTVVSSSPSGRADGNLDATSRRAETASPRSRWPVSGIHEHPENRIDAYTVRLPTYEELRVPENAQLFVNGMVPAGDQDDWRILTRKMMKGVLNEMRAEQTGSGGRGSLDLNEFRTRLNGPEEQLSRATCTDQQGDHYGNGKLILSLKGLADNSIHEYLAGSDGQFQEDVRDRRDIENFREHANAHERTGTPADTDPDFDERDSR